LYGCVIQLIKKILDLPNIKKNKIVSKMEEEILRIDYDGNWKIITTELIEDWVAFFMPETLIRYGTEVRYLFNSYVVAKQKESELLANNNPFAIVVLANLYVAKTHNNLRKRLTFKEKLYELAFLRGYSVEKITKLFIFVNELMLLSSELEKEYKTYIQIQQTIKKEENMRVLSKSTMDIIDIFAQDAYGKTMEEIGAMVDNQAIIIRSIFNLKDSMNLTAAQIASILGVEIGYVEGILEKKSE
jgi:hypothetical protein